MTPLFVAKHTRGGSRSNTHVGSFVFFGVTHRNTQSTWKRVSANVFVVNVYIYTYIYIYILA